MVAGITTIADEGGLGSNEGGYNGYIGGEQEGFSNPRARVDDNKVISLA